jgi:hypothetical protein
VRLRSLLVVRIPPLWSYISHLGGKFYLTWDSHLYLPVTTDNAAKLSFNPHLARNYEADFEILFSI